MATGRTSYAPPKPLKLKKRRRWPPGCSPDCSHTAAACPTSFAARSPMRSVRPSAMLKQRPSYPSRPRRPEHMQKSYPSRQRRRRLKPRFQQPMVPRRSTGLRVCLTTLPTIRPRHLTYRLPRLMPTLQTSALRTQALSGAPAIERGVAWSTLGQASISGETTCTHDGGSDDGLADLADIAPGSLADSPDPAAPASGTGTHRSPDAGTLAPGDSPTPMPVAPANTIAAVLPQAIGQVAQAIGSIMPWAAFGIRCSLVSSNARAANRRSRRERSASVSQRRPTGDGRRSRFLSLP